MAKSMKSKIKKKMRNIKRQKVYGPKELARLKKCLANAEAAEATQDTEMVTVRQAEEVVKEHEEKMDVGRRFDKKTMKDENGQYPEWMNQRQIQKKRAETQKTKKLKARSKKKGKTIKW